MTDKDGLHDMPPRLSRRQVISGMASLGVLTGGAARSAFGQAPKRVIIPEGDFAPLPIAIPNFVAGKRGGGGGGGGAAPGDINKPTPWAMLAAVSAARRFQKSNN